MQNGIESAGSDPTRSSGFGRLGESKGKAPFVLGIGGTNRANSSSELALRVSMRAAERLGVRTRIFSGSELALTLYNPGVRDRGRLERELVQSLRECDGLIIAASAYHGTISGLLKNVLDYAEDLREDERVYLDGIPVGCIACGAGSQAASQTISVLRTIAHSLRGWPTPLGVALNSSEGLFDSMGQCKSASANAQLETVGQQVAEFALRSTLFASSGCSSFTSQLKRGTGNG